MNVSPDQTARDVIESMIAAREAKGLRYREGVREAMLAAFRAGGGEDAIMAGLSKAMREHRINQ